MAREQLRKIDGIEVRCPPRERLVAQTHLQYHRVVTRGGRGSLCYVTGILCYCTGILDGFEANEIQDPELVQESGARIVKLRCGVG